MAMQAWIRGQGVEALPKIGRRITKHRAAELLAGWPDAEPTRLANVEETDHFWRRAADHFRLRLLLHYRSRRHNLGALYLSVDQVSRIVQVLADRLLWRLVPARERPPDWPRTEKEFAKFQGVSSFGLRLWMRIGKYGDVEARIGPLWSEEDITKELVDRLTDRALHEMDMPHDQSEPRYVELALKARKVIGANGQPRIENLTLTKNEVNISVPEASDVRALLQDVAKAARELGMTQEVAVGERELGEVAEAEDAELVGEGGAREAIEPGEQLRSGERERGAGELPGPSGDGSA